MKTKPTQKNIPDGWKYTSLGDLYTITSSKRVFQDEWTSEGVPFYRAREIVKLAEHGFVNNELYISRKMFEGYKQKYGVPQKEDLLVTGVGTVGIVYRIVDKKEFYFKDGNIIWFKSKGLASSAFIEQLYKSPVTKNKLLGSSPITTVATYTIDAAKKAVVCLPPRSEQDRIVSVLETWDKVIEKILKKLEIKRRITIGLKQDLLTAKKRLPGFRGKWQTFSLKEISKIYDGTHQTPTYVDEGVPFYSVEHVTSNDFENTKYISEEVYKNEIKKVRIEKGDILMTRIGSIGAIKYVDWNVKASFYVTLALLKIDKRFDSRAISFFLTTRDFQDELYGKTLHVAFPNKINLGDIGECKIYLPEDIDEQKAIANILLTADKEILGLEKKLQIIKDQKDYLLNNLITGTIRTPEKLSTHN